MLNKLIKAKQLKMPSFSQKKGESDTTEVCFSGLPMKVYCATIDNDKCQSNCQSMV